MFDERNMYDYQDFKLGSQYTGSEAMTKSSDYIVDTSKSFKAIERIDLAPSSLNSKKNFHKSAQI